MISHDRLFKELISTFFREFVEAFLPKLALHITGNAHGFLDKETFKDMTRESDLFIEICDKKNSAAKFLILLEIQAHWDKDIGKRLFAYFARLLDRYKFPIYPVLLYAAEKPQKHQPEEYVISALNTDVLSFRFELIQLNRLNWHQFCKRDNPAVAALMAKMKIAREDRSRVKLACMSMIARLKLPAAESHLLINFVDTYLNLSDAENRHYRKIYALLGPMEQEEVMAIMTSWRREARQEGRQEGRQEEAAKIVSRLLTKRFGEIDETFVSQIQALSKRKLEELADAILDFESLNDAISWLSVNGKKAPNKARKQRS